ncbi:hypothetical protein CA838_05510 [Eikenella corrodens]|nr:hypothetical protein CA838_05510 [Eikenella corrodens]
MCRWIARPLPELRNGCLPRVCTGGGRAVCCYDTGIPIYKGVCRTHARGLEITGNGVRATGTHPTPHLRLPEKP